MSVCKRKVLIFEFVNERDGSTQLVFIETQNLQLRKIPKEAQKLERAL